MRQQRVATRFTAILAGSIFCTTGPRRGYGFTSSSRSRRAGPLTTADRTPPAARARGRGGSARSPSEAPRHQLGRAEARRVPRLGAWVAEDRHRGIASSQSCQHYSPMAFTHSAPCVRQQIRRQEAPVVIGIARVVVTRRECLTAFRPVRCRREEIASPSTLHTAHSAGVSRFEIWRSTFRCTLSLSQ